MNLCILLDRERDRVVLISGSGDVVDRLEKQEAIQAATKLLDLAGQIKEDE